jgi:hypothetical protein
VGLTSLPINSGDSVYSNLSSPWNGQFPEPSLNFNLPAVLIIQCANSPFAGFWFSTAVKKLQTLPFFWSCDVFQCQNQVIPSIYCGDNMCHLLPTATIFHSRNGVLMVQKHRVLTPCAVMAVTPCQRVTIKLHYSLNTIAIWSIVQTHRFHTRDTNGCGPLTWGT